MLKKATQILLVNDNAHDAGLLRAAVADVGSDLFCFKLLQVDRLAVAMAVLASESFDVVQLVMSLPDSSGLETISAMRRANPAIPIVVISGLGDERVAVEAMRMGAQDYLVKGQIDSGKMRLKVAEVCVVSLFEELRVEFTPAYQRKGIELDIASPQQPTKITTDPVKLKEILRNLIENARKYTDEGRVSLQVDNSADGLEFVVSDTGRGIPADLLPKIFELFYQEDESNREYASAGLGLNIVKRLVGALAGEITVTSELGKGSIFRVRFPSAIAA